jgi:hypothetical protein
MHCYKMEICAKTWKVSKEGGEGFSDFVPLFSKILQNVRNGDRKGTSPTLSLNKGTLGIILKCPSISVDEKIAFLCDK